ncbi:hypothetical protein L1D32_16915 [Shewanella insulae]|uniref:hypothetical protein n=1 Tax=Shewanella insulae TaxID=2681496 RepID=UPI001EFE5565|nr:hypothetical protein [Shewanella insulae]MCG9711974.1 hypothetical protein [Shewanella insulae]MCG9739849.1 hypothetical protein [Shewanella insulae]
MSNLVLLVLLLSSGVDLQNEYTEICVDVYYSKEYVDSETGELITKEWNRSYYYKIRRTCGYKVELMLEGLKVLPVISDGDVELAILESRRKFKSIYRERIRCRIDPQKCKEEEERYNKLWGYLFITIIIIASIKFGFSLYSSYLKKTSSKIGAFAVAIIGAVGTPASWLLAASSIMILKDLPVIGTMVWWILFCCTPYFVGKWIARVAGLLKDE